MMSLIEKIKKKKELAGLADSFIEQTIENHLTKKRIQLPLKEREEKLLIKEIRADLRKYVGRFQYSKNKDRLVSEGSWDKLLATHASTKERLPYYSELKELIKRIQIHSILDLGCGLNPLALADLGVKYYAIDIRSDEVTLLEKFFKEKGIEGQASVGDIRQMTTFPKTDLCLLLKVVDLLDTDGHKTAEQVLTRIPSKYILVSFSTKTLSGKPMNHPQRGWIERLCTRLGYTFERTTTKNEIFYLIEKP